MAERETKRRGAGRPPALVLVGGKRGQVRKASKRSWTKVKERKFLSALAETCNVTRACEAAGVSDTNVYQRRKVDAAFRAGWLEAIATAYQRLELVLIERALNGTEKIVTKVDGREERMREYPNHIALQLLKMHRDTAIEAATEVPDDQVDETRRRLHDKLERLRARVTADDAAK